MNSMELKKLLIAGFMTCLCACNCVGEKPENPDDQQGTVTPPVEETYDVTVYKTSVCQVRFRFQQAGQHVSESDRI